MKRITALVLVAACLSITIAAPAEAKKTAMKKELHASITPLSFTARSCSPIVLSWQVDWAGRGLLEGAIELEVRDEGQAIYSQRIDDVVLQPGAKRFHSMLPAYTTIDPNGLTQIHARFVTARETFDLGTHQLRAPTAWKRNLVVAICEADTGRSPVASTLSGMLTVPIHELSDPTEIRPALARIAVENMPNQPLEYCTFDIVMLTGDALEQMRGRSITAIEKWVRAGGSLLLVATDSPGAKEREFLTRLDTGGLDHAPSSLRYRHISNELAAR